MRVGLRSTALKLNATHAALTPHQKAIKAAKLITEHFKKNSPKFPNTDDYDTTTTKRIVWGINEVGIQVKKASNGKFDVVVPFYDSNGYTRESDVFRALKVVLGGHAGLPPPSKELKAALKGIQLTVLRVGN